MSEEIAMSNKRYYVDFGPELLQLLGPNLYTNIYYVLGEIIANAYDADAENVYIIYDTENNTIIVEDDGTGMTYEQFNARFLPIGVNSRNSEDTTYTESGQRKRIGRKGIGKLAALSVAERVKVISVRNGDKSGCILSLNISSKNSDGRYEIPAIPEDQIVFRKIDASKSGSSIIMENSRYSINKTIESAKRNISLIFPFPSQSFRIHLENLSTGATATIDDTTKDIVMLSDALITFSDENSKHNEYLISLHDAFDVGRYFRSIQRTLPPSELPEQKLLHKALTSIKEKMYLETIAGEKKPFDLTISGWISTFASSSDKKRNTDFPVNHISIIANDKLGQFDILPDISTDRMGEAYVVGQFFVDLLEETQLPDIAASNRQGYKEDDPRFEKTLELIRKNALRPVLELKSEATKEKNYLRDLEKANKSRDSKEAFDKSIREVVEHPDFKKVIQDSLPIKQALEKAWELKDTLKETYKKIMISHSSDDKLLIDELERVLHFCGFEKDEIIYTSSDHYESGFEAYTDIYDYLKEFFVNTTRRTDLCVIYVLNEGFVAKWDPVLEAGAGWVLNSTWYPMYTDAFGSVRRPFPGTEYTPKLAFEMNERQARTLAGAIYQIAEHAGKQEQTIDSIFAYIKTTRLFCA
ncbi:MAG: ATP-binding protein [Christensenellales bacterium]|jgi:hypothetical protein